MAASDNRPSQDDLDELQELMERVSEDVERVEKVVRAAAVDRDLYEEMRGIYQRKAAQVATRDDYYPYTALDGEFMIGFDPDGRPLGISRRQLNEHMLVVGRTGAGKTTFFYTVMDGLDDRGIPFLAFEFKNDYRSVAADLDLTVINWRDLKFNPLQPPPGVPAGKWAEIVAEIFAHATDLLVGSHSYTLEKLRQLYRLYDDTEVAPSLFELRDLVRAHEIPYASPRFNYKERVTSRLSMMTGFSGDIFDCSRGYPIEDLLGRNVVLELQEPNQYVTNFVVEALLTRIFYYRDAQGHAGGGLRHAVLFDEAKRVFDRNREQQPESGFPPIDDLMGKIRAFGEAVVVADHEPSKLTDSLKANTNVKLWMSLGSGHDTEEMAETFGVEDGQVDFTRTLERGEAVVATAEQSPVPVRLPPYHVETAATSGDVEERTAAVLDEFSYRERVRPDLFETVVYDVETDDAEEAAERELGEVAEALLASVNEQPFLSMSERYDAIDVGSKQGNRAKNELLALELVREVEIDTKKPGRNPKLLELTEEGEQVLADRGYDVAETGRRGIEHRYWQRQVVDHYEDKGYAVEIEYPVRDGRIDVYVERPGSVVAVEVAMSPEHEVENVEKCLETGADRVEVVAPDDGVRERIEAAVKDAFDGLPEPLAFVATSKYA